MSLRLRLTLFAALLVGVVLLLAGLALRQGVARVLQAALDRSLQEALALAQPLVSEEDGHLRLGGEGEVVRELPGDLGLLLYQGDVPVGGLGQAPPVRPAPREGCFAQGEWRFCGQRVEGGFLLAGRPLAGLEGSLAALDRVLLWVGPAAFLLASLLGYLLLGHALAPVHRLTAAARTRAQAATPDPLPLPQARDELRTLAEAFNALLEALAQALERERRFTQDAAHELRTPLTVFLGRLEQAEEENQDPRLAPRLAQARRGAERLLRLAEDLLHLARAESPAGLRREVLDLRAVAREVAEDLEPLFAARGVTLEVRLPLEPLWVLGDRAALALAVRNLLDNALKFASKGRVRLLLRREGDRAFLAVEDQGPGFPEAALPHLFQRFYQAQEEHRRMGSGLGLALVRAVVQGHKGGVWAENRPEGGARVGFWLPLEGG